MTDPKRAFIDPSTGERIYYGVDPKDRFKSVTTYLSSIPKPFLMPWAAGAVAATAAELIDELLDPSTENNSWTWAYTHEDGEFDPEEFAKDLAKTYEYERDSAGELGDIVHDVAEELMNRSGGNPEKARTILDGMYRSNKIDTNVFERLCYLCDWLEAYKVEVIATEFTVYNDTNGYAGSCDLFALVDGVPYYIDYKSGKGVYPETALQLTAYSRGEYVVDDDGLVLNMPHGELDVHLLHGGVLHLEPHRCRFIDMDCSDVMFDAFLALMLFHRVWVDDGRRDAKGKVLFNSKKK